MGFWLGFEFAAPNMSDSDARPIRISSNTKIKPCVTFSLDWFDNNDDTPLVLHTLPYGYLAPADRKEKEKERTEPDTQNPDTAPTKKPPRQEASTKIVTTNVPRLISVVEIIKREFLRNLAIHHSPRLAGLHQYTEIGCLEDLPKPVQAESSIPSREEGEREETVDERAKEVVLALSGKNHVRETRTPYMKITLSLNVIPSLLDQGASYQPPTIRRVSKSAKSRAKKRARRTEGCRNVR
ncbi:hypothetical protein F5887DRAFT_220923 [Amanita rubescens]|nr:hypothetical protein F5887DRAFT_220923 [Amanita rubescens]